jgi:two-component system cell cycle sensor histidine kinase/response regulator CckA
MSETVRTQRDATSTQGQLPWLGALAALWGGLILTAAVSQDYRGTVLGLSLTVGLVAAWRAHVGVLVIATILAIIGGDYLLQDPMRSNAAPLAHLAGQLQAGLLASVALLAGALLRLTRHTERTLDRALRHLELEVRDRTESLSTANAALEAQTSQRQQSERERVRLDSELRRAHRLEALGRLAGGVAHDFNNLLMVIQGYGDLLLTRFSPDDPSRTDLLEITKAAERGSALTRQLLAFGRKQMLRVSPLDLNVVVRETSQMLLRLIGENIHLKVELAEDACAIEADSAQLEQVLMNIAVNARDAMSNGGVLTIGANIVDMPPENRYMVSPGRYARLVLADTGCGMDEATRARLFEPFFTTKDVGKGSGLGLATVYGIVTQLGGHIDVESAPRCGTTFTILFPATTKPILPAAALPIEPLAAGVETVLLVEDDAPVRALSRAVLQRHGYTILEAENSHQALAVAAGHAGAIDLVLTDVVMPDMTGPEMVARLTAIRPVPRVLYVSGYSTEALVGKGVLPDGVDLVQKPVAARELLNAVRRTLDARPAASQAVPFVTAI